MCMLPVPPVVGPSGVVTVVEVIVCRQQVTNAQTISVLQSHVRAQTITTERKRQVDGKDKQSEWGCSSSKTRLTVRGRENLHMISDEAPQRSDGQVISEEDDAVLKLIGQSGRSEQHHTPKGHVKDGRQTHKRWLLLFSKTLDKDSKGQIYIT